MLFESCPVNPIGSLQELKNSKKDRIRKFLFSGLKKAEYFLKLKKSYSKQSLLKQELCTSINTKQITFSQIKNNN